MQRARFVAQAFHLGLPASWNLVRQLLSITALLGIVAGLRIAGLPLLVGIPLGVALRSRCLLKAVIDSGTRDKLHWPPSQTLNLSWS